MRPVTNEILHGITRQTMLRIADKLNMKIVERFYTLAEAIEADEAMITASSIYVLPVGEIDTYVINDGKPGPFTLTLRRDYLKAARAEFYKPQIILG